MVKMGTEILPDAYCFFRGEGFSPVDEKTYPLLQSYENGGILQGVSAVFITTWAWAEHGLYALLGSFLCTVYFPAAGQAYFIIHFPADESACSAPMVRRLIDLLWDLSCRAGLSMLRIKHIEERRLPLFQDMPGYTSRIHYNDNDSEYIFGPADIFEMDGNVNAEKRRSLRKCATYDGISLVPVINTNLHLMSAVQEQWCKNRECAFCESFCGCEKTALEIMMAIFDERIHRGLFLFHGGDPAGYAIGGLRDSCAFVYYGKSLLPGFFTYLIHEMTQRYFPDAEYINMGEDMGNQGLRFFKSHLGSHTQWRRYICDITL